MNNLARLPDVRHDMNADGATTEDDSIVRAVDRASRFAESFTNRQFVARLDTRYLRQHPRADCRAELDLFEDLTSITGITVDEDGDETFELTLVENTDYYVIRERDGDPNSPIVRLDLNPNSDVLTIWPTGYRSIRIVGLWGYSYELESTGLTIQGGGITASALTATVSATAADLIYPGDVLVAESEQIDVTGVNTTTLTFGARGINGTTAAIHAASVALSVRRYPRDVERAVTADAARYLWWASRGMMDQTGVMREPWPMIRDSLHNLKRWAVA